MSSTQRTSGLSRERGIFCGTYVEPAGHVGRSARDTDSLTALVDSAWRRSMDTRFLCAPPVPTEVLGSPGHSMECTRRQGGWRHVVLAVRIDSNLFIADGVKPAEAVLPRAIGVMSGRLPAQPVEVADTTGLETQRRAAQTDKLEGANAIAEAEFQLTRGGLENRRGNYAAAEAAYRAVTSIQERLIGRESPALAVPLARQALQVSNQGRFAEAEQLFLRAERLAALPNQIDPVARPMVAYLRALNLLNLGRPGEALQLLDGAERTFSAIVPRDMLVARARVGRTSRSAAEQMADAALDAAMMANQEVADAFNGMTETRRYRAVALSALGRSAEAESALAAARDFYSGRDPRLSARYFRTAGMTVAASGQAGRAASELGVAANAFARSQPLSLPLAETLLLQAAELVTAGRPQEALPLCQAAAGVLETLRSGLPANRFVPCLRAYGVSGGSLEEMFALSQFAQGTITSRQIARATARLAEGARDPRVAEAMRARDRADQELEVLYQGRAEIGADKTRSAEAAALDQAITNAQLALREAGSVVQAAAPRLSGLVQETVSIKSLQAVMRPDEALAAIVMGDTDGWTFLIRRGGIRVGLIEGGSAKVDALVKRIRTTVEPGANNQLQPFDTAAAHELYALVLSPVAAGLAGARSLTVAASGSLLSIPFTLLLTAPHADPELAKAPFLVRQYSISHVPSVGGFVNLRNSTKTVRASRQWFGLGDFRPPSPRQASATFPPDLCGENARLFASLGPLPGARRELEAARLILGASPDDQLIGAGFTAARVKATPLHDFRMLHFATHALLPSELRCQAEPAVLTSTPADAPDASGASLTASQIEQMNLDAELVILAACNTGGGDGAGESLSGLARSFFFAGARALLVTHWEANDATTTYLTALFLQALSTNTEAGPAVALATAQRRMLDESVGSRAMQAHPSYWAVEALIGG